MKNSIFVAGEKGTSCIIKTKTSKKTSLQTIRKLQEVSLSASMTLEASIALPLFIFFFINLMSAISIIRVQSELEAALHQTGLEIMQTAYDVRLSKEILTGDCDETEGDDLSGILKSVGWTAVSGAKVKKTLSGRLEGSKVMDGAGSLSFLSSHIMQGDDIVDIVASYKVHPVVSLVGFKGFTVESRFYGHAWTGYDITGGSELQENRTELVYITENGEVYHKSIDCRYLKPSISSISYSEIPGARNKDRARYYACEYCGDGIIGGNVFITNYGTRYHSKVDCPGLKRKIYTVPISEVHGKRPCSACGG